MTASPGVMRRVTRLARSLLADNPSPMTLDGTNSYLLAGPGSRSVVVVDPGPADERHLQLLAAAGPVELILITHRHGDHTAGAPRLGELTGAPVRGADPAFCLGAAPLADGELIDVAGVSVRVMATPGHSSDSVCFKLVDDRLPGDTFPDGQSPVQRSSFGSMLTGDTILGRGTTVIAEPDGSLGAYLASLRSLTRHGPATVLPAHGQVLPDLAVVCATYLAHRAQRLDAVRRAVAELGADASVNRVTDVVYADTDPSVRRAAEMSVAAQLEYLRDAPQ